MQSSFKLLSFFSVVGRTLEDNKDSGSFFMLHNTLIHCHGDLYNSSRHVHACDMSAICLWRSFVRYMSNPTLKGCCLLYAACEFEF